MGIAVQAGGLLRALCRPATKRFPDPIGHSILNGGWPLYVALFTVHRLAVGSKATAPG